MKQSEILIRSFIGRESLARLVLQSFNDLDFCHIGWCPEAMETEYHGYIRRFMELWEKNFLSANRHNEKFIIELVRRSFHPSQISDRFITEEQINILARDIYEGMPIIGIEVGDEISGLSIV